MYGKNVLDWPILMHPLSNVYLWHLFRAGLEGMFRFYSRRIALLRQLGFQGTESVLDIGCGTGQHSEITTGRYLGVDLDARYIEFAKKRHPGKEFLCMDVSQLQLDGEPFDVALMVDIIHHLSDEQARKLLADLARLTAKRVYFFEPVTQSPGNLVGRMVVAGDRGSYIRPREKLLELIRGVFAVEEVRDLDLLHVESVCIVGKREPSRGEKLQ